MFGKLLSDVWSTGPKFDDFWPKILLFCSINLTKTQISTLYIVSIVGTSVLDYLHHF